MGIEMHWHEQSPTRWEAERRIAKEVLDDFRSGVSEIGIAFVEGRFRIRSQHGHTYDVATLRIEYPPHFPERGQTPKVVLLSHRDRWQPIADAHIFSDWSLCLFVPSEAPVDFSKQDSLNAFFAVLQTYLFKQWIFQRALAREQFTGRPAVWPGEARSHGVAGVAEAVQDAGRLGRNAPCPCGSGLKFKNCHMRLLRQ